MDIKFFVYLRGLTGGLLHLHLHSTSQSK